MNVLVLRPGHDRRIRAGHPWVFSNEVAESSPELKGGQSCDVLSSRHQYLGTGYYNPHSLICSRLLSRRHESIDTLDFFLDRLTAARDYRCQIYAESEAVRVVHGEADGLPGLIVDRYGDVLSIQLLALGMDCRRDVIIEALRKLFDPTAIVARNDAAVRELEGLPRNIEILDGELPEETWIQEHGLSFQVDVLGGQKTGQFLDQKENHLALRGRVEGRKVLDLFCYSGAWSIHAAKYGALSVTGVDISAAALGLAEENARRNGVEKQCGFLPGDVFEILRKFERQGEKFGTIVLDPPAFVKSRKKLAEAVQGYLTVNRRAMALVEPGGHLFTCSCSYHMSRELFLETLRKAGAQAGRTLRLLELRGQAWDHPVLLSCPETEYLKCAVLQVM